MQEWAINFARGPLSEGRVQRRAVYRLFDRKINETEVMVYRNGFMITVLVQTYFIKGGNQ